MGGQRNRSQMKKQLNSPRKLDKMGASNLSDRELPVMIIRILKSMKRDIQTIQKDQSEIKDEISICNIYMR